MIEWEYERSWPKIQWWRIAKCKAAFCFWIKEKLNAVCGYTVKRQNRPKIEGISKIKATLIETSYFNLVNQWDDSWVILLQSNVKPFGAIRSQFVIRGTLWLKTLILRNTARQHPKSGTCRPCRKCEETVGNRKNRHRLDSLPQRWTLDYYKVL